LSFPRKASNPALYAALLIFFDARPDISQRIFPDLWPNSGRGRMKDEVGRKRETFVAASLCRGVFHGDTAPWLQRNVGGDTPPLQRKRQPERLR
jgi:hypothetical protein